MKMKGPKSKKKKLSSLLNNKWLITIAITHIREGFRETLIITIINNNIDNSIRFPEKKRSSSLPILFLH